MDICFGGDDDFSSFFGVVAEGRGRVSKRVI
jgi:hypothetical protein